MNDTSHKNNTAIPFAILCDRVSVSVHGRAILHDITLRIPRGSTTAIIGHSGAGKTTLARTLTGLCLPTHGSISIFGTPVTKSSLPSMREHIGYIPQDMGLVEQLTAWENIMTGCFGKVHSLKTLIGIFPSMEIHRARQLISLLRLEHVAHRTVRGLSGGERRRVAIARALIREPRILIADEFLSDLDHDLISHIATSLKALQARLSLTIIMVEHDPCLVHYFNGRAAVMRQGRLEEDVAIPHETGFAMCKLLR